MFRKKKEPKPKPDEEAWEEYVDKIYAYARSEFERVVKPWLKKRGYDFLSGNGTYFISKPLYGVAPGKMNYEPIYEDEIPKRVLEVLDREIEGMSANSLGSIMPNYDYATDVQNNGE